MGGRYSRADVLAALAALDANGAPVTTATWLWAPGCSTGGQANNRAASATGSTPSTTPAAAPKCWCLCAKPQASMQLVTARREAICRDYGAV
jgi:hypothetical protein